MEKQIDTNTSSVVCSEPVMATLKDKLRAAAHLVEKLKEQLYESQREYDRLYQKATGKAQVTAPNTSADHVASLLEADPSKQWDYDEIAKQLPNVPRTSVRVYLYQLQKERRVKKVGRAKWQAENPLPEL